MKWLWYQSTLLSGKRSFVAGFAANSISDAAQALINIGKIGQNKKSEHVILASY
jgi:hypothetical protein